MNLKTESPEQKAEHKIEIRKVKIDKNYCPSIEFIEHTKEGIINHTVNGAAAVHDDFRIAMKALVPHIADLCDQYGDHGDLDTEHIVARGVTSTDGKNPGWILTGVRELKSGKKITLNTPLLSVETDEEKYPEIEKLREAIITIGMEVRAYLFTGKKASDSQGELFPEGQEEQNEPEEVEQ